MLKVQSSRLCFPKLEPTVPLGAARAALYAGAAILMLAAPFQSAFGLTIGGTDTVNFPPGDTAEDYVLLGRNVATPHINNASGDNALVGQVTLGIDDTGDNYVLESTAGTLTVSNQVDQTAGGSGNGSSILVLTGSGDGELAGGVAFADNVNTLEKSGAGTWTVSGTSAGIDAIDIFGGTLVNGGGINDNVDIDVQGVFDMGGIDLQAAGITGGAGGTIQNGGELQASSGDYAGSIDGGSTSLLKSGNNTLILSGNNTYGGGTTVTGGTLDINSASGLGTGSIDIDSGATLDSVGVGPFSTTTGQNITGEGTWNGNVIATADSVIAPGSNTGSEIGALTFGNNLTFDNGSFLNIDIDTTTGISLDGLFVDGLLSINDGATLAFDLVGSWASGDYLFATSLSPVVGMFDTVTFNSAPDNWTVLYNISGDDENFNVVLRVTQGASVPVPATIALIGAGLVGVGFTRRRRSTMS